jgi:cell division protein FtsL
MMKKVVKKANKSKKQANIKICFVAIFVLYLMSSILLRNYNLSLEHQLNGIKRDNTNITSQNLVLNLRIDELSSFERMSQIAQDNGLENREGTIRNVG